MPDWDVFMSDTWNTFKKSVNEKKNILRKCSMKTGEKYLRNTKNIGNLKKKKIVLAAFQGLPFSTCGGFLDILKPMRFN